MTIGRQRYFADKTRLAILPHTFMPLRAELSEPAHARQSRQLLPDDLSRPESTSRATGTAHRLHQHILVALALVIYACVMGLQFKQAMHEQADAPGQSLTTQTATSATELLVANDILSLNVLLGNLVKNPLVAHAAIYSVDNRILAEAGQRPRNSLLGEAEGLYQTKITFEDVTAGQLRISLDMSQFQQPMLISLQSMGILAAILLVLALTLSLRQGRFITLPLLQLRVWLRDPQPYTPATDRQTRSATSLASCMRAWPLRRHLSQSLRKRTTSSTTTCTMPLRQPRPHRAPSLPPRQTRMTNKPSPACWTTTARPRPPWSNPTNRSTAPCSPCNWGRRSSCAACHARA